jgi:hypothetical protein
MFKRRVQFPICVHVNMQSIGGLRDKSQTNTAAAHRFKRNCILAARSWHATLQHVSGVFEVLCL